MSQKRVKFSRRRLLQAAGGAGALLLAPSFVPSSALGKDGTVAPSERIVLGALGIGGRGTGGEAVSVRPGCDLG